MPKYELICPVRLKIAILTNIQDLNPGYSLTSIIQDQCLIFQRYGHEVHLFVNETYNPGYDEDFYHRLDWIQDNPIEVHKVIPFGHLDDYTSELDLKKEHGLLASNMAAVLKNELQSFDIAITHDLIFTGWNLPYALGIRKATSLLPMSLKWMHWVHSVPSRNSDWWRITAYGPNHKIIFPNNTDRRRVAEQFRGNMNHVRVIPHPKDLRSFFEFGKDACDFIDDHPGIMDSEIVQVYPASTDRLSAKGLNFVIEIFSNFKKGFQFIPAKSICLVIANQWATGKQRKEDIKAYCRFAEKHGLEVGKEFIFISEWCPDEKDNPRYPIGIPRRMLRELAMMSNLFIFPTSEESFGLVSPEICLASGCFPVLNHSLPMQYEIYGRQGIYFNFGSHEQTHNLENPKAYFHAVAMVIIQRMAENEGIMAKTHMRISYNWDRLYQDFYGPVFAESETWE